MNKVSIFACAAAATTTCVLIALWACTGHQALASSESAEKRYSDGYSDGYGQGQSDQQKGNNYYPRCDPYKVHTSDGKHTVFYCNGWQAGYDAAYYNSNNNNQRGNQQSSDVNIRGNGNHVTVNQGQSQQDGNDNGGSGRGGSGGGINPTCRAVCIG